MSRIKIKYFPCWVCKGRGGEKEIILDDGSGPYEDCGWCEGEGMILIGGKVHRKWKREELAIKIIEFIKPEKEEYSFEELQEIGEKALCLVEERTTQ